MSLSQPENEPQQSSDEEVFLFEDLEDDETDDEETYDPNEPTEGELTEKDIKRMTKDIFEAIQQKHQLNDPDTEKIFLELFLSAQDYQKKVIELEEKEKVKIRRNMDDDKRLAFIFSMFAVIVLPILILQIENSLNSDLFYIGLDLFMEIICCIFIYVLIVKYLHLKNKLNEKIEIHQSELYNERKQVLTILSVLLPWKIEEDSINWDILTDSILAETLTNDSYPELIDVEPDDLPLKKQPENLALKLELEEVRTRHARMQLLIATLGSKKAAEKYLKELLEE